MLDNIHKSFVEGDIDRPTGKYGVNWFQQEIGRAHV